MTPRVLDEIAVCIKYELAIQYQLISDEGDKPKIDEEGLAELLQYHWASDINKFPRSAASLHPPGRLHGLQALCVARSAVGRLEADVGAAQGRSSGTCVVGDAGEDQM